MPAYVFYAALGLPRVQQKHAYAAYRTAQEGTGQNQAWEEDRRHSYRDSLLVVDETIIGICIYAFGKQIENTAILLLDKSKEQNGIRIRADNREPGGEVVFI